MDDLIEFLLELVFDIGEAAAESSRTPRWLRRLLMWIFGIFAAVVHTPLREITSTGEFEQLFRLN